RLTKLLVVDVDPDGIGWYRENSARLACGRVHKTSRGFHLLYRMPAQEIRNSTSKVARGIDVRAEGGYIIWWPAHGPDVTGSMEDLTEPPAWLLEAMLRPQAKSSGNGATHGGKYGQGERHGALLRVASSLRRRDVKGATLEGALLAWNAENCDPPQDAEDVR